MPKYGTMSQVLLQLVVAFGHGSGARVQGLNLVLRH